MGAWKSENPGVRLLKQHVNGNVAKEQTELGDVELMCNQLNSLWRGGLWAGLLCMPFPPALTDVIFSRA